MLLAGCGSRDQIRGLENAARYTKPLELQKITGKAARMAEGLPVPMRGVYADENGDKHEYLYQAGTEESKMTQAIVFAHGAQADATEGMCNHDTSKQMRKWALANNMLFVCPEDYCLYSLRAELAKKWGIKEFYGVGLSMGGRMMIFDALHEANPQFGLKNQNRQAWTGLLLLCPALPPGDGSLDEAQRLKMPVFVAVGEKDRQIARYCRQFAAQLKKDGGKFVFVEYPDTGHGDLPNRVSIAPALEFIVRGQEVE